MPRHQHAPRITFLSEDWQDNTITLAINGVRYEYWFKTHEHRTKATYMIRHWPAKGLNFAKSRAAKVDKLS